VEVRCHLGPLLGADATAPLVDQVAPDAPDPRAANQPQPANGDERREQHRSSRGEAVAVGQEDGHRAEDQQAPDGDARNGAAAADHHVHRRAAAPILTAARPQDGEADGAKRHWPGECLAEPEAGDEEDDDDPDQDQGGAQRLRQGGPEYALRDRIRGRFGRLQRRQEPGQQVDDDPEAERHGEQDEGDPHRGRLDPQVMSDSGRHAADHAVAPAALQPRARGAVHGGARARNADLCHRRMFAHARRPDDRG